MSDLLYYALVSAGVSAVEWLCRRLSGGLEEVAKEPPDESFYDAKEDGSASLSEVLSELAFARSETNALRERVANLEMKMENFQFGGVEATVADDSVEDKVQVGAVKTAVQDESAGENFQFGGVKAVANTDYSIEETFQFGAVETGVQDESAGENFQFGGVEATVQDDSVEDKFQFGVVKAVSNPVEDDSVQGKFQFGVVKTGVQDESAGEIFQFGGVETAAEDDSVKENFEFGVVRSAVEDESAKEETSKALVCVGKHVPPPTWYEEEDPFPGANWYKEEQEILYREEDYEEEEEEEEPPHNPNDVFLDSYSIRDPDPRPFLEKFRERELASVAGGGRPGEPGNPLQGNRYYGETLKPAEGGRPSSSHAAHSSPVRCGGGSRVVEGTHLKPNRLMAPDCPHPDITQMPSRTGLVVTHTVRSLWSGNKLRWGACQVSGSGSQTTLHQEQSPGVFFRFSVAKVRRGEKTLVCSQSEYSFCNLCGGQGMNLELNEGEDGFQHLCSQGINLELNEREDGFHSKQDSKISEGWWHEKCSCQDLSTVKNG